MALAPYILALIVLISHCTLAIWGLKDRIPFSSESTSASTQTPLTSTTRRPQRIYYDGKQPESDQDDASILDAYDGVRVEEIGGLFHVDFCMKQITVDRHKKERPYYAHSCYDRCLAHSSYYTDQVYCNCDFECYFYNDCCVDYEILCVDDFSDAKEVTDGRQPKADDSISTTSAPFHDRPEVDDYFLLTPGLTSTDGRRTGVNDTISSTMDSLHAQSSEVNDSTFVSFPSGIHLRPDFKPNISDTISLLPQTRPDKNQDRALKEMDLLRSIIPQAVENRVVNEFQGYQTCFTPKYSTVSFYIVTTCPGNSSAEEHNNCANTNSDAVHFTPIYSLTDQQFYANEFCAACHGHTQQAMIKHLTLSCESSCTHIYQEDAPQNVESCEESECFSLQWGNPRPLQCLQNLVTNCTLDGSILSKVCHSYTTPVYTTTYFGVVMYKNVHCARCNDINGTMNLNCPFLIDYGGDGLEPGVIPLTVLFDFTDGSLQESYSYGGQRKPLDCLEHFKYDRQRHTCRRVSSPDSSILINEQCVYPSQIQNLPTGVTFDPLYRKMVVEFAGKDNNVTDTQIVSLVSYMWYSFQKIDHYSIKKDTRVSIIDRNDENIASVWDGQTWMKSAHFTRAENQCFKKYNYGFILTIEGTVSKYSKYMEQSIPLIEAWLSQFPSCPSAFDTDLALVSLKYSNIPNISRMCNSTVLVPKPYGEQSATRVHINWNLYEIHMQFPNNKTKIFDSIKVPQEIIFASNFDQLINQSEYWGRPDKVYFCETAPFCALVTLNTTEYEWQYETDGKALLVLKKSGKVVPNSEIILSATGKIQICVSSDNTDYDAMVYYSYSSGQSLTTVIGCAISLTLLALVIITYCTFSTLRNVPGKTVLSLSTSLFFAQLLFLVGAGQTANWIVCLVIACVIHFSWLSVFSWTNILAFDLARTFGKKSSIRGDDSSGSLFLKYSVYGWGIPVNVVMATILLNFFQEIEGMVGNLYGIKQFCWLRGGYPVLIAFGVPVAIALIINVMFFVRTIHGIRSTMKSSKILKSNYGNDNDLQFLKKELGLYIRLSISVGLTWISGFIIPYTGLPKLGYLFIILNSLQGPVIFISFICSQRVLKLWKEKFRNAFNSGARSHKGSSQNRKTTQTQVTQRQSSKDDNV